MGRVFPTDKNFAPARACGGRYARFCQAMRETGHGRPTPTPDPSHATACLGQAVRSPGRTRTAVGVRTRRLGSCPADQPPRRGRQTRAAAVAAEGSGGQAASRTGADAQAPQTADRHPGRPPAGGARTFPKDSTRSRSTGRRRQGLRLRQGRRGAREQKHEPLAAASPTATQQPGPNLGPRRSSSRTRPAADARAGRAVTRTRTTAESAGRARAEA
jgi:hypothetical protein